MPCADIGAVLVYQSGDEASRLLPVSCTWYLFWNWIYKIGQLLCSGHGLPGRGLSCEKPLWQEQFWGRGGWVSSWGSFESSLKGIPQKSATTTTVLVLLCGDLVCGPFGVKSWPEREAQSRNAPMISASPGQPSEWREEGRAGGSREGGKASIWVMSLKDPTRADFQVFLFTAHSLATNFLLNQCVDKSILIWICTMLWFFRQVLDM